MDPEIIAQLAPVFKTIFQREIDLSTPVTSKDFPDWDSFKHVTLMVEIERVFNIRFDGKSVAKMTTIEAIVQEIKDRQH